MINSILDKYGIRGKFKGLYFISGTQKITPSGILEFAANMSKLSKWINKYKNIEFCDYYSYKFDYDKRYNLYDFVIKKENLLSPVDYLEFGVCKGESFKWWVEKNTDPSSHFYGFDTFTGLPEDWGSFKKGDMSGGNEPPKINDSRCSFYQGLFQQTLPDFLSQYKSDKRKVIHMDADLYSSTLFTLTSISPFLRKDDIIFFDEFNVPLHEFKAFDEWVRSYYIQYEVIGAVNNFYQTAIKIL
jgi:O-methyltransferase